MTKTHPTSSKARVAGEVGDGAEAVTWSAEHRPDIVLMDVRKPVMDGLEATRLILRDPASTAKVIMLTAFDLDEYSYQALLAADGAYRGLPPCRMSSCIASSRTAMVASAAARKRVGAQTDGDPRPGQRMKITGGASGLTQELACGAQSSPTASQARCSRRINWDELVDTVRILAYITRKRACLRTSRMVRDHRSADRRCREAARPAAQRGHAPSRPSGARPP